MRIKSQGIFIVSLLVALVSAFDIRSAFRKWNKRSSKSIQTPVEKIDSTPVLKVLDPDTQCTVHLLGVSHGAATSAELVRDSIDKLRPSTVVLELCEERYLSICLETKIKPNVNSPLMNSAYEQKMAAIEEREAAAPYLKSQSMFAAIPAYFKFIRTQGVLVGSFISMGLFVGSLQRFSRAPTMGDEFTTSMRECERLNIPVRLGDALQSDTLKSVQQLASLDLFNPQTVIMGAKSLAFSAFGANIDKFPDTAAQDSEQLQRSLATSNWVNIPLTYAENTAMIKSLLPIFLISMLSTLLGYLPEVGQASDFDIPSVVAGFHLLDQLPAAVSEAASAVAESTPATADSAGAVATTISAAASEATTTAATAASLSGDTAAMAMQNIPVTEATSSLEPFSTSLITAFSSIGGFLTQDVPPNVQIGINTAADLFSLLLLIRMGKIIGNDRDRIIASKIQAICKEFPGTDVVVVVGMLHCNGVARWLLSGQDPLEAVADSIPVSSTSISISNNSK